MQTITERLYTMIAKKYRENKVPILATFFFGILAYGFVFTNKLPNEDDLTYLFAKGASASSGRWGLDILAKVIPNFSIPWIHGLLTLLFMAVSICIIIRLFSIKQDLVKILLAGSIVVFPSLIGTFGYMFTSSSYGVGILLTMTATWLMDAAWERKKILWTLPALGCMVFSIGIYQAYVTWSASLMVVLLIKNLTLDGMPPVKAILKGIVLVFFLGLSLVVYYLIMEYTLIGTELNDYAASAKNFQIYQMPERILMAYQFFVRYFTECYLGLMASPGSVVLHLLVMIATCVMVVMAVIRQNKTRTEKALMLAGAGLLTVLLPLAITSIYLFVSWWTVYMMVLYSFTAIYVYAAVYADHLLESSGGGRWLRRVVLDITMAAMAVIISINVWLANEAYLSMHLRYENTYGFFSTLISDLRGMPEFEEGRKIAIVGSFQAPWQQEGDLNPQMQESFAVFLVPGMEEAEGFVEEYLGMELNFASAEEEAQIQQTEQFQQMPIYPYYGSTKLIGDILVTKLS